MVKVGKIITIIDHPFKCKGKKWDNKTNVFRDIWANINSNPSNGVSHGFRYHRTFKHTLLEYVQLKIFKSNQIVTKQREEISPKSDVEQMGGQTDNVKDMINLCIALR